MSEACRALNTPVVSGNVSFYNETEGRGILPTPVIGMVGLIADVRRVVQHGFKNSGDLIAILGTTGDDLSISEYAATIEGRTTDEMIREGRVPLIDLERELAVQKACLLAAEAGLLHSAHDCSDGGLAVALAECCFSSLNRRAVGADISLEPGVWSLESKDRRPSSAAYSRRAFDVTDSRLIFSESPSRIVISFDEAVLGQVEEIAARAGCEFTLLGRTGSDNLSIKAAGAEVINLPVAELEAVWRSALASELHAEVLTAG
jgi:phosphoribosylformylglycinamidine synthase